MPGVPHKGLGLGAGSWTIANNGRTPMEEQDHNGQNRPLSKLDRETAADTLTLGAAITICLGAVMLIGGIVAALTTSYKVGAYASFAGGLTTMIIGANSVNGGVALVCHRLHVKDNARTHAEIREMRAELREVSRDVRALIAMQEGRTENADDQVGAARRSHEN